MPHAWLQAICHRDLKLENILLDDRPAPRLKICDFGYSKVSLRRSVEQRVVTPASLLIHIASPPSSATSQETSIERSLTLLMQLGDPAVNASQSSHLDSQPKSKVGTSNYLAPEQLSRNAYYNGQQLDVWSCGVTLFVMLVGALTQKYLHQCC